MQAKTYLEALEILRGEFHKWNAPVVSMIGYETNDPYLLLISTIMSLRTKDETTAPASRRLFRLASTPDQMIKLTTEEIEELIYPVGFYRNKASQILELSHRLINEFDSKVPDDLDALLSFRGVGRKTANLVLSVGFDKPAICVDIHVHRISNRLGFVKTKTPDETELQLMKKLPKSEWNRINDLLVAFGQTICKPVSPFCSQCKISHLCEKKGVAKSR